MALPKLQPRLAVPRQGSGGLKRTINSTIFRSSQRCLGERIADMASVTIDGRPFSGSRIQITGDGHVLIDGVPQEGTLHGRIEIHVIEGAIENLECGRFLLLAERG